MWSQFPSLETGVFRLAWIELALLEVIMKRDYLALFCGLLVVTGVAISPQVNGQTEIPTAN